MKKKTHEEFLQELKIKNIDAYNDLNFLDRYINTKIALLAEDKYGLVKIRPDNLLRGKDYLSRSNIHSAIDKHSYFLKMLEEKNPKALGYKILDKYTTNNKHIRLQDKYGIMKIKPNFLLMGTLPTIMSAINKHEYYVNQLKEKNPYAYDNLEFLEEYSGACVKILARDRYGLVKVIPDTLLAGFYPDIKCAINKHEYFLAKLKDKNIGVYNSLDFIEKYKGGTTKILARDKYGELYINPAHVLTGRIPTIETAKNKTEYLKAMLAERNPEILKYEFVNEYKDASTNIKLKTKYGICSMRPCSMMRGSMPDINSAVNKYEYTINQFKDIHGNKYEYPKFKYIEVCQKIQIRCKKHGVFRQSISGHKVGQGCPKCNNSSGEMAMSKILTNSNISFIEQYKFDDCKNINSLPFDFYISDLNTAIE